jgi:putative inorganic carbon (hco3(-)) transporter
MREIALIAVIAFSLILSIGEPRIGVLVYVWFALSRPDVFAFSTKPFYFVIAVAVGLGSLRVIVDYRNIVSNWTSRLLLLSQIPIALSILMAVYPDLCAKPYNFYIKTVVMSFLIPVMVADVIMMRRFLIVAAFSLGFVAVKFGLWGVIHGGVTIATGYGGIIEDNNGLALGMAMLVPLAWYARDVVQHRMVKLALLGITALAAATVIMTGSRGNSVGLAVVLLLMILQAKRKALALAGLAVLTVPTILLVGQRYLDRMATMADFESEQSAASRIVFAQAALRMWSDYPIFGVGFGQDNYRALSPRYLPRAQGQALVVHNTYLQTLVDSGIMAFALFVLMLYGAIWSMRRSVKAMKAVRPDLAPYPLAIGTSLVAYAVGCTFYSRPAFEIFYIVLGGAAAWQVISRRVLAEEQRRAPHGPLTLPALAVVPPAKRLAGAADYV